MILTLLISLSLAFSASCRVRIQKEAVLIKDARIVGTVKAGTIVWKAGEDQAGEYYIVTKAYPAEIVRLGFIIKQLKLEKAKEEVKGEKK